MGNMRGMALLSVLIALAAFGTILSAAVPVVRGLYAQAAVEYEAVQLVGELRRIQAVSRMTAMPLSLFEGQIAWKRVPLLRIHPNGYTVSHPYNGIVYAHAPLPLVCFEQETKKNMPIVFDRNGGVGEESHNMTIRVYAVGCEDVALRVVIDGAARIRLERRR
ncbi:hypothetical protein GCM10008919_03120 [Selenomonas dianae]|uniref:Uncharacterized protein n=2 Tax=Selenomonas dianae TaxID=135079 RepID=A0ABN0SW11_9FIRM